MNIRDKEGSMTYIATFFSHFGAMKFKKYCDQKGWPAKLMPVPRSLSSSCGTCVKYEGPSFCPVNEVPEEVEQIAEVKENQYGICYKADGI